MLPISATNRAALVASPATSAPAVPAVTIFSFIHRVGNEAMTWRGTTTASDRGGASVEAGAAARQGEAAQPIMDRLAQGLASAGPARWLSTRLNQLLGTEAPDLAGATTLHPSTVEASRPDRHLERHGDADIVPEAWEETDQPVRDWFNDKLFGSTYVVTDYDELRQLQREQRHRRSAQSEEEISPYGRRVRATFAALRAHFHKGRSLLRPIRGVLEQQGVILPEGASNPLICHALGAVLWPMADHRLPVDVRERQDALVREVLNALGWAEADSARSGPVDQRVRRAVIAEVFAYFALGASSPDAFLKEALIELANPVPHWHDRRDASSFRETLMLAAVRRRELFEYGNDAAIDLVAQYYAELAKSRSPVATYTGVQLASALGRNEHHLSDEERMAFETLAALLRAQVENHAGERDDADFLKKYLVQKVIQRWAIAPETLPPGSAVAAAEAFIDTLLPGVTQPLTIGDAAVREGSMTWCDHVLAHQVLRSAQSVSDQPDGMTVDVRDTGALALLAEQQLLQNDTQLEGNTLFTGNVLFERSWERLAWIWAALQPETLPDAVDWRAVARGDGQTRAALTDMFGRTRATRWEEVAARAEGMDGIGAQPSVLTRRQVAEQLLRASGLDPFEEIDKAPEALDWGPPHQPKQVRLTTESLLDVYLSSNTAASKVSLRKYQDHDLPDIDVEYRKHVRAYLDGQAKSIVPFIKQLIKHGNGPRDTVKQWSVEPKAHGMADEVCQAAARDWFKGEYYTRDDRDFLLRGELRISEGQLIINDKGHGRYVADRPSAPSIIPTSLLLTATLDGEVRRYLFWMRADRTMAITRFAESIGQTGLDDSAFHSAIGPSVRNRDAKPGNVPSAREEREYREKVFFRAQMARIYELSRNDRDNLMQPRGTRTVMVHHRIGPVGDERGYRLFDDDRLTEFCGTLANSCMDRVFQPLFDGGYEQTHIQGQAETARTILTSMIPFHGCVSSAINGQTRDAVVNCAADAIGMIPVVMGGVRMAVIATKTAAAIVSRGRILMRLAPQVSGRAMWKETARQMMAASAPAHFAELRLTALAFGDELLPPLVQFAKTVRRLGGKLKAAAEYAKDAQTIVDALGQASERTRNALVRAYASELVPFFEDGQRMLRQGTRTWPLGRLSGTDLEVPLIRSSAINRENFIVANPANDMVVGPELVMLPDGSLRPVVSAELRSGRIQDGVRRFELTAEVYRDDAGAIQPPVVEHLASLTRGGEPGSLLLGIDGHPYVDEAGALRRLTLAEQARLQEQSGARVMVAPLVPEFDTATGELLIVPVEAGADAMPPDRLGLPPYYLRNYAVKLPKHAHDIAVPPPGADGVIRYDGACHIETGASATSGGPSYYRVLEPDADGITRIVHPAHPSTGVQIAIRYDSTARRWALHNRYGLQGGQPPRKTARLGAGADAGRLFVLRGNEYRIVHRSLESGQAVSGDVRAVLDIENWRSDADAVIGTQNFADYRALYDIHWNLLGADQKAAVRGWTYVDDGGDDGYPDGGPDGADEGDIGYDLNRALRGELRLDEAMRAAYANLYSALAVLPSPPMFPVRLLRVADVPAGYANRFNPGDIVTNAPAFMSASSSNFYAQSSVTEGAAAHGAVADTAESVLAFFLIKSRSAKPMMPDVTTRVIDEREWLFLPDSVFKIESITYARTAQLEEKARVIIVLDELAREQVVGRDARFAMVKNLHSGVPARVYAYPGSESVSAGERVFDGAERSIAVGDSVTLYIHDVAGPSPGASGATAEEMDTILRAWHWKGRPALENVPQYRDEVMRAPLPPEQRQALEGWRRFADHQYFEPTSPYMQLTRRLSTFEQSRQPSSEVQELQDMTDAALQALPRPLHPPVLLHLDESELDDLGRSIFETKIQPGDLVSSGPYLDGFVTGDAFLDDHGRIINDNGDDNNALILMEITSPSARPLNPLAQGEVPWMTPRNCVFRVERISIGEPVRAGQSDSPRTSMRVAVKLTEVEARPAIVKDLTTGQPVSLHTSGIGPLPAEAGQADASLARLHPDLRMQAHTPSRLRHWLDQYAVDASKRSFSEDHFDLLIRGRDPSDSEQAVDRAFLGSLLREAYLESPTFRRLFNYAYDTYLRNPSNRWLLRVDDEYATSMPHVAEQTVISVNLDPDDTAVYATAQGVHRFDAQRSFLHEVIHALTLMGDVEQGNPRGPVVEYTNIILKEMGHDAPARTRYDTGNPAEGNY